MFDVNLLQLLLALMGQVGLVLMPTLQPSWTHGTLKGSPCSGDQRQGWEHAGHENGLLEGVGREQRASWVDSRDPGSYWVSLHMLPAQGVLLMGS